MLGPARRTSGRNRRPNVQWAWSGDGRRQGQYDCVKAFSETDFTDDLKAIAVPTLVMHGEDDKIVPFADAGPLSAKLLRNAATKFYPGFPHGMPTTHGEQTCSSSSRADRGRRLLTQRRWGPRRSWRRPCARAPVIRFDPGLNQRLT